MIIVLGLLLLLLLLLGELLILQLFLLDLLNNLLCLVLLFVQCHRIFLLGRICMLVVFRFWFLFLVFSPL